jgi:Family of unknown function (DUF5318)
VPSHVDYALARRAVLNDLRRGVVKSLDVCDAHPELMRAARNVGTPMDVPCPVCSKDSLRLVSYVYGDGLKDANGRCLTKRGELEGLARKHDEFARYVVEVCHECRWNHLKRRELHGRLHRVRRVS